MAINPYVLKDYYAEAVSRYPNLQVDKPVFDRYVKLLLSGLTPIAGVTSGDTVNDVLANLMQIRSIDTAVGYALDNIGAIVGEPRGTLPTSVVNGTYFVFAGTLSGGGFSDGSSYLPPAGGIFADQGALGMIYQTWSDATYRIFLKAKVLRNSAHGTPQDILNSLAILLGNSNALLMEGPDPATITLAFSQPNNPVAQYLITGLDAEHPILPIPLGVGVNYITFKMPVFAFYGVTGAAGFGEFVANTAGYGIAYGVAYGTGASGGLVPGVGGYFSQFVN